MVNDNLHRGGKRRTNMWAAARSEPPTQHKTQLKMIPRQTGRERCWAPSAALLTLAAIDLIFATAALQVAPTSTAPDFNSNQTNLTLATNSSRPRPTRVLLPAECANRATCKRSPDANKLLGLHKRTVPLCRCDEHCKKFDDCCQDSGWAETQERRLELGVAELRRRRREFQCRMISASPGHLLVKAKCNADWLNAQEDRVFAEHTRQKCELTLKNQPVTNASDVPPLPDDWIQADPMGSMIPVTDRLTGITYLNSHCVRCNLHEDNIDRIATAKQLIYWTPLVKCNYDPELGDDRNKLYELLAAKRGDALKYSPKHRRWYINIDALKKPSPPASELNATTTTTTTTTTMATTLEPEVASRLSPGAEGEEEDHEQQKRSCTIMPTVPKDAEHLIRRCVPNLIDECLSPPQPTDCELMRQARVDCAYNHQALVYSFNTTAVYFNLGCARCNRERIIHCKPPKRRKPESAVLTVQMGPAPPPPPSFATPSTPTGRKLDAITLMSESETPTNSVLSGGEKITIEDASAETGPLDESGTSDSDESLESMSRATSSGSFAVLFDMEPLRHSDAAGAADVVGQAKRCFGNQYFDFFENKCRCAICGIWKRYINGACVDIPEWQREGSNLTPPPSFLSAISSSASNEMPTRDGAAQTSKREVGSEFSLVNETHLESAAEAAADKRSPIMAGSSGHEKATPADVNSPQRAKQQQQQQQSDSSPPPMKQQQQHLKRQKASDESHSKSGQQVQLAVGPASATTSDLSPMLSDERIFRHFEQLPVANYEARWAYTGCAKTNVPPSNYRLFNITELFRYQNLHAAQQVLQANLNGSATGTNQTNAAYRPDFHLRKLRPNELELVWAYVAPWNVTLPPGKYELRRTGVLSEDGLHDEMELYICIPIMPRGEDKFDRHMVWLTTLGLLVSITSLLCYLALYFLSSLDLRHLVVRMSRAGKASDSLQDAALSRKYRKSCASQSGTAGRSQSLSSRGVACLAASLLAAYIFFMLGNQLQYTTDKAASLRLMQEAQESERRGLLTNCKLLAAATICAFLMAFNWMFLLSFDIWRILRLATYQLRGPSSGSQSMRFFIYATFATFSSIFITLMALGIDQWDPWIRCGAGAPEELLSAATWCPLNVAKYRNDFDRFVHRYKPYFGHQPGSCWFVNRRALGLFFGLPVALIITANLLFFLHSSYMVLKTSSRSKLAANSQGKQQQQRTIIVTADCKSELALESPSADQRQSVILVDESKSRPQQQQQDFTQQNALTTSSLSSVRTMQSAMSLESSEMQFDCSRRGSSCCGSTNGADFEEIAPETLAKLASPNTDGAMPSKQDEQQVAPDQSQSKPLQHEQDEKHLVINMDQASELHRQMQQIVAIEKRREAFKQGQIADKQKSSISLASHRSTNSLGSNLAQRYDSSKSNLTVLMSSMGKDYRLYCRLSTIMGVTWLTGLLASLVDHSETLWYIFVLLNTLQGLFIFIAFGFKRSRLTNLEILVNYAAFKIRHWTRDDDK